jgi:DnaK suppressor protein
MTTADLQQQLQAQQTELQARIDGIDRDFAAGRSADSEEQATELENDEVLVQLKNDALLELADINRALEKLDAGEYGLCEECGKEIHPARLEALPYARYCIDCAA